MQPDTLPAKHPLHQHRAKGLEQVNDMGLKIVEQGAP
jgi:hypothetical protein